MSKSGISSRRGKATLNTEQRKSEHGARFPRHPKYHLSTVPAQPQSTPCHGSAAAYSSTPAQTQPQDHHFHTEHGTCKHSASLQAYDQGPCTTGQMPQRHSCTQRSSPGHGADHNQPTNHPHPLRGHQPAFEDTAAGAPPSRSLKLLIEPMRW